MVFKWKPEYIMQMFQLIKNNPEYRATFFNYGLVQRVAYRKYGELLLDLVKDDKNYLASLKSKGLIKQDGQAKWIIQDAWKSNINNPARSKLDA
jgi:hypothetical protein